MPASPLNSTVLPAGVRNNPVSLVTELENICTARRCKWKKFARVCL